jgi:outer membrane protein TolC
MDRDSVARRAFEIYERRGRTDGRDLDDWLEAERELTASEPATATATATAEPASVSDKPPRRAPRRRAGPR